MVLRLSILRFPFWYLKYGIFYSCSVAMFLPATWWSAEWSGHIYLEQTVSGGDLSINDDVCEVIRRGGIISSDEVLEEEANGAGSNQVTGENASIRTKPAGTYW